MIPEIQALCIQYITDEWRKLRPLKLRDEPPIPPPWGVWIRLYDPVSPRVNAIDDRRNVLRKAWFLDAQGAQERDPWVYARFITVNGYRPWASGRVEPVRPEALWGRYHQIGLAAFAEFDEADAIYLEMQWGTLFGHGYRMIVDEKGVLRIEKNLWRS